MTREPTIAIMALRAIVGGMERAGVDPGQIVRQVGIEPSLLGDDEARMPATAVLELCAVAARATGDESLGLHSAEHASMGVLDVIDYILCSSENLGEGYQKFVRYQRILTELAPVRFVCDEQTARLRRVLPPHPGARVVAELFLGLMVLRGRHNTGQDFLPVEICFQYERPVHVDEHERLFGPCKLRFQHWETELVLERSLLDTPMLRADSGLAHVLERYAGELAARRPPIPSLSQAVREKLAQNMTGSDVSLHAIAKKMNMSSRTLQRRLAEEHVSFGHLVEEVRRDLAERYLDRPELALTEIAFLLGFSDVSSFHRAFKRWTGETPVQFRERPKR